MSKIHLAKSQQNTDRHKAKVFDNVRVRIAPSPTGSFHVGTARTALFNYLFAKKHRGEFILRFEDTDKERSKKKFEEDISAGLKWLGLNWDGEIKYQKDRLDIYQKNIDKLIKSGSAYEKDGAVWFKIPTNQIIEWDDLIRGKIQFNSKNDKDFVIVRSDKTPLFALSNVIDDFEIDKVTHVIRGEDHISNTPRQILIAKALGYNADSVHYAHLPMILNKDRSKMSKRKDPVSLTRDFRDMGYLPEAMFNFMALLGWNPGECCEPASSMSEMPRSNSEIMSKDQTIEKFDIKKVGKSPAIFEMEKLDWLNGHYIRDMKDEELYKIARPYFNNLSFRRSKAIEKSQRFLANVCLPVGTARNDSGILGDNFNMRVLKTIKSRLKNLSEIPQLSKFYFEVSDYKKELLVFKNSDPTKTLKGLEVALASFEGLGDKGWQLQEDINKALLDVVEKNRLSNGDVFWPIRVALSGLEQSPSPTEILWVLGKEESLSRIRKGIKLLS